MSTRLPCEAPVTGQAASIAARLAAQVPQLTTQRLRLRAPIVGDFGHYADIVTGPRGCHLGVTSRAEAWLDFAQMVAGWSLRGHGLWSVEPVQGGALCGFVLLGLDQEDHEPELGYLLTASAEGRGLAFEAAARARAFAFDKLKWPTLVSYIDPGNTRSLRLAGRLGAVRDTIAEAALDHHCQVWRHPENGAC